MARSDLYILREEVKYLVGVTSMPEKEKKKWKKIVDNMIPSELLDLRKNALENVVLDVQLETIAKIKKGNKEIPDDEKGLEEFVMVKVMARVGEVEKKMKAAGLN
jgi:hypothetical protein